ELSGGMRQRTAIARAFAYKGDLLLMDEPFKSLDLKIKESLMKSLITLFCESDLAILIVTHDHSEAAILCDRIVILTERPCHVSGIIDNPGDKLARLCDRQLVSAGIEELRNKSITGKEGQQ